MSSLKPVLFGAVLLMLTSPAARADTLFSDLGGKPGLDRLVTKALTIWAVDPLVAPTFAETNLVRFKRLFLAQMCMLTGGDCEYSGRSMAEAHKGMHLTSAQFNAIAEDLQTAMEQLDVSYSVQSRLLALLAPMHRDVVAK